MGRVSTYCRWRWHEGVPPHAPQNREEAIARIDQLYDSGTPFFTKDEIRAIHQQLQRSPGRGDEVLVRDVAGTTLAYTLRTGETFKWPSKDSEEEFIIQEPQIHYHCRADLKHILWTLEGCDYEPETQAPLRSLQIYQNSEQISPDTKELIEVSPLPTHESLTEYFQQQIQAWKETDMCKRVVQILNQSAVGHDINKIIAVALSGLLSRDDRNRSAFQHALVLTMQEWLQSQQRTFSCYAQDPDYNCVDKAVLSEHGIEVIDDPRAWLEVDERSILFSCAPNVPVKQIVADIARPAVVIWEKVGYDDHDVKGESMSTDPCSPRVRAMMRGYEMFEFGADDHFWNAGICIDRERNVISRYFIKCTAGWTGLHESGLTIREALSI